MKLLLKIVIIMAILGLFFAGQFVLFGGKLELLLTSDACGRWLAGILSWGWLAGIGLLAADLVLPIPASGVIAALGSVYGIWLGGLAGTAGGLAAGFIGYGLARFFGRRCARFLVSDEEQQRFQDFFDRWGAAAIILSRPLPMLPEIMTILAGLARMRLPLFAAALTLGVLPTSLLFAFFGYLSQDAPVYGLIAASLFPLALWALCQYFFSGFFTKETAAKGE